MTTAILVGGQAKRMGGTPKGLMHQEGVTILERLCRLCQDGPIFLVGHPQGAYANQGYPIFADIISERGAPGAVLTALQMARSDWVRILACDLPTMDGITIESLRPHEGSDVVLYRVDGKAQYLVSLWRRQCLPILSQLLKSEAPGFGHILKSLRVTWLNSVGETAFCNMNTPQEALRAGYVYEE